MKSLAKKLTIAGLGAACALTLTLGAGLLSNNRGFAQAETNNGMPDATSYFYDNLRNPDATEYTLAKKFYKVLEQMNDDNDFIDGVVDYPLDDVVTSDQLKGWIENGNLEVPKAFSAARDSFLTDHPELFYINFYKMTISVAKSGGAYVGFINSGREANLYYENGFNTQAKVEEAIAKFNNAVDGIVAEMNALAETNKYSAEDQFYAIEVNRYLAKNIKYDYVAYDNKDDPNYIAAAYINSAYGGLVEKQGVCGCYSTSYKVIMDKLGIPCITVNGYTNNKDSNGKNAASSVYHMWNYVWLETPSSAGAQTMSTRAATGGKWYSVDVTWNYSSQNKDRYAVLNAGRDAEYHVNDGKISSSGYELQYPTLSLHNYGSTGETDGLQYSISYNRDGDLKDDNGEALQCNYITVSYNGKSALRLLEEDGLYIAYRNADYGADDTVGNKFESFSDKLKWTQWTSLATVLQVFEGGFQGTPYSDDGIETRFYDNTSVYATQFAIFDVQPDGKYIVGDKEYDAPYYYSYDLIDELKALEMGELIINQTYGTYTPPPYIQQSHASTIVISDSMRDPAVTDKLVVAESKGIVFEVTYDEPLHILDDTKKIGISFTSEHPSTSKYAKFFPVNDNGDLVELVQRPKNSGDPTLIYNTLRFKFGPSLMYEHNEESYHFAFSNVGSAKEVYRKDENNQLVRTTSDKAPNPAQYNFGRQVIACPACFNYDGRLWVECCAQPTLLTQTDLSEDNFKDENGKSTFNENERSQMMLVAERANTETVDAMLDAITENNDINVTKNDIKTSETYDISLQMCNKYPKIPDGSYVKIALGFPEGYGPNDAGVTFKIFHRKHVGGDNYIIEEIPCVVTQFGIVATVTSFSPYMVAVVDADKATDKTVYASIEGKGGNLTMDDGKIQSLTEGKSYTYSIVPNKGYQIYSVKLNGKEVKDQISEDGKFTVSYADLEANNELVIQYIAEEAAQRIQQKLESNVIDEDVKVNATNFVVNTPVGQTANNGSVLTAIVITLFCVVVVAGLAVILALVVKSKKKTR